MSRSQDRNGAGDHHHHECEKCGEPVCCESSGLDIPPVTRAAAAILTLGMSELPFALEAITGDDHEHRHKHESCGNHPKSRGWW